MRGAPVSTYRVGSHWGVTIIREGTLPTDASCYRRDDDQLVAVVVNGDRELAERICALLNAEQAGVFGCDHCDRSDYHRHIAWSGTSGNPPAAWPRSTEGAEQPRVDAVVPSDGADTLTVGCDCGHEGLDTMFHLAPCPIAELSRTAHRLGYELTLSRWEVP
jgi:hypothetical protein